MIVEYEFTLGDAFDLQMGKTPARDNPLYWGDGNKWVAIADIKDRCISETKECISDLAVKETRIKIVPKGTLIMSFKLSVGKVAFTAEDMYTNEAIMAFIDKGKYPIDMGYLFHYLGSQDWRKGTNKAVKGLTLNKKTLSVRKISLPLLDTQREVAHTLDLLDRAIQICQQLLEGVDGLVKSQFVEMFGDPTTNPKKWDKLPLGERCKIVTGNTPPRADAQNYGSFLEWIKSDNINTPGTYLTTAYEFLSEKGFECCRYVEAGSVLMTCIAGSIGCIGNVGVADRRVAFNQQINAIVPDEDETMYIYWLMQLSKPFIQSTVNMALKGILSKSKLSALEFPFPPVDLQQAFSAFAVDVEKSKVAVTKCLQKTECLKSALMQQYFG